CQVWDSSSKYIF
nr:immunoglobulin light chain junction region [Macaca mulatta]MPO03211.1 immunoglobulin light chain junction region [Macaca mulatta]MPO04782.1 immunoglobulin light chain junction region [Macaca mulatta]MPO05568.1 immunoglobulin light chain junction region [Macaca mulatta]MPO07478.1 immunoglobulin light chain junction region [Macaca mulatta]